MIVKRVTIIFLLLALILIITILINTGKNKRQDKKSENINQEEKGELKKSMKLIIENEAYEIKLDNNEITMDIINMLPLDLTLKKYDNHEYYSELDKNPRTAGEATSNLVAGHVYYWGAGNSFVINYIDYDISPYKEIHIGEITDKKIVDILKNSPNNIRVRIEK